MRSNYKKLGQYISPQNFLNDGMEVKELLGISNQKYFQKSHTNIIGIDLSTYRIVRKNQFAFNRATTRNGERISIALRQGDDCIVSPSYRIFKVKDENQLLSEYLLMWFKRPEFDRYVRFKSHGSAHEFFEYDQMCEVELPIPSIAKQKEIVKEYNVIQNRIVVNKQLIQKLEETAQAIYKQWFVDFEFPDENGMPYKSSGGEMVLNEELEKEIPKGWEVKSISEIGYVKHGYAFKGDDFSDLETQQVLISPGNFKIDGGFNFEKNKFYLGKYPKDYLLKEDDLVTNMTDLSKDGDTLGNTALIPKIEFKTLLHNQRVGKIELSNRDYNYFMFFRTNQKDYKHYILGTATGTTVRHTSPTRIGEFKFIQPNKNTILAFNQIIEPIIKLISLNPAVEYKLKEINNLLLSKLATLEK
jgi:type I restriction enzyme, S subunit